MKHILLPLALLTNIALHAQQPAFKAPHGGQLVRSEAHCIEMVLRGDEVRFYLLDTLGSAVPAWGGVAYIRFADQKTANPVFEPLKDGGFRVVLTNPNAFTVVPSFKTGNGFASAEMSSGPRMSVPPVQQHNADDGHGH
ncbi:MAG: hypothetical protein ACO1NQ_03635 [Flavobacteriales bacterium]|jgi:hypothetical protein|nr:hypothetical protein [Flavobacteriales bacterium]